MDKHQVLIRLIGVVTLVIGAAQVTTAVTCYYCTDEPGWFNYDPDCADYSYNGTTQTRDGYNACYIDMYIDGFMWRGVHIGPGHDDGDCYYEWYYTECYCIGDYCNTESYCSQCHTTIEVNTLTTTNPPPPTTDETTFPSTTSPISLTCYHCVGCSSIDSSTPVISDASYQSCVMTVILNSGNVIRDGSYDQHPDGECVEYMDVLSCWCSSSICNNIEI
ncbi:unnamed protein product [Meganyctiphanes norvegica]|uniref:Uncharacterized protein n=1 Tax=Meganyctiphanes norvegica TaxID=48144 RepID=A0AAV2RAI6_MEGNR